MTAHYGFMESPDVIDILRRCRARGLETDVADTSFYLGRETLILKPAGRAWPIGASSSFASCRATRARPPTSSLFRPTAWSR